MKKSSLLFFTILVTSYVFAQEFAKLTKDTSIGNKKIFKKEIYEIVNKDTVSNTASILFGKENLIIGEEYYEILKSSPGKYQSLKDSFIVRNKPGTFSINVSRANIEDTIKFIASDNSVSFFPPGKMHDILESKAGDFFRLVIPNSPTLVYYSSEIGEPEIGKLPQNENGTKKSFFSRMKTPLLILAALIVVGLIYVNRKRRSGRNPVTRKYTGGSLEEFAAANSITLNDLIKFNEEIPKAYKNWEKTQRQNIQKTLNSKYLIIGWSKSPSQSNNSSDNYDPIFSATTNKESMETGNLPDSNSNVIIKEIKNLERNLNQKIESLSDNKSAEEVKKLKQQIESISSEKNQIVKELSDIREGSKNLEAAISKYSDKIIFVDFLENYARTTVDYFTLLHSIEDKSFEISNKLSQQSEKDAVVLGLLIVKHQSGIPSGVGKWEEIVSEIKNKKTISNSELIRGLSQPPTPEEKFKAFQRMMHAEVLEKYTGITLLLAEELSHFSKFTGQNTSIIQDIELSFTPLVREIVNKSKSIGLEVKHVPLFENYQPYASFIKVVSDKCSMVYRNIKVDKDGIAEILSYGFGSEQTKVILG